MTTVRTERLSSTQPQHLGSDQTPSETSTASLLPAPMDSIQVDGDLGAQVAALVMQSAREHKRNEREAERAAGDAQEAAEKAQVAEMHKKAEHIWKEAVWSGLSQIASGALSVCSAAAGQETVTLSEKTLEKSLATAIEKTTTRTVLSVGAVFQAAAKGAEAPGTLAAGYFRSESAEDTAGMAQREQEVGHAKLAYEEAHDRIKETNKLRDDAISFYREYMSGKDQAQRASIHRA